MFRRVEVFSAEYNLWYDISAVQGFGHKHLTQEEDESLRAYCAALPAKRCNRGLPTQVWLTPAGYRKYLTVARAFGKALQSSPFSKARTHRVQEIPGSEVVHSDEHFVAVVYSHQLNQPQSEEVIFIN